MAGRQYNKEEAVLTAEHYARWADQHMATAERNYKKSSWTPRTRNCANSAHDCATKAAAAPSRIKAVHYKNAAAAWGDAAYRAKQLAYDQTNWDRRCVGEEAASFRRRNNERRAKYHNRCLVAAAHEERARKCSK